MPLRQTNTAVRGGKKEARPWVFPTLKVDGVVHAQEISIPNTGQEFERAMQQAAQKVRQIRAAEAAEEAQRTVSTGVDTVPSSVDSEPSKDPNSGSSAVNGRAVLSTPDVEGPIREWLAQHLPSSEQLFAASASLVGLQGIDARVRDLVASFQEGLDGYRKDFTAWRDGVVNEWADIVGNAGELLTAWGAKLAEIDAFKADLEKRLFAAIADKVGPQGRVGNTGMAGAAVTVVDRLPKGKGIDFTRPYLKRDAVVGDICIDGTTDMRYGWRWDGQRWERGPAMVSLQVRDVRVSAVDNSTKAYTTQNIVRPGGGGGGGGERLMVNSATRGAKVVIADSSNWVAAGIDSPQAGTLLLSIEDTSTAARGAVQAINSA